MPSRYLLIIVLMGLFLTTSGQKITITGEKKQISKREDPELSCIPVKVSTTMKINSVEGNCKGFWIQKGSKTIHKFKDMNDAVGTKLSPGIYYVYPYIKEGEKTAKVTITIERSNGG